MDEDPRGHSDASGAHKSVHTRALGEQELTRNGLPVPSSTREAVPECLQHSSVSDMIKKALIKSFNLKSNINTALC